MGSIPSNYEIQQPSTIFVHNQFVTSTTPSVRTIWTPTGNSGIREVNFFYLSYFNFGGDSVFITFDGTTPTSSSYELNNGGEVLFLKNIAISSSIQILDSSTGGSTVSYILGGK